MSDQAIVILRDAAGQPTHAVVPWGRARGIPGLVDEADEADDAADLAALEAARADDDGFRLPLAFARRIAEGEHVVTVLREWRGLDQTGLAARLGTKANYLSQIETRARRGVRQIPDLARALDVPEGLLREHL